MPGATEAMRKAWAAYECQSGRMKRISFARDSILVAPETAEAWKALECVLAAYDYDLRVEDTDSYCCREIKSGGSRSLHSYGIALDINWNTNPYIDHSGQRGPRFSGAATQAGRAQDVKLGKADTDMTRAMVDAVLAIKTMGGKRVFGWGGDWQSLKDAMHFQIEVTPAQIKEGIDWTTVQGSPSDADDDVDDLDTNGEFSAGEVAMGLPKVFFDTVRKPLFGGALTQSAVENMETIVGYWLRTFPANPLNQLAYILATVLAEVGQNMRPVRETFAVSDAQARARLGHKAYGKPAGPYGHVYYGRGYVQLTWLANYQKQSQKLGVDLVQFPDKALQPAIAIQVLVKGMMDGAFNGQGHGLAHYVNSTRQDFVGARRTVNLQDRASEIAGYAVVFNSALQLAASAQGGSLQPPAFESEPDEISTENTGPMDTAGTEDRIAAIVAAVLAALGRVTGGLGEVAAQGPAATAVAPFAASPAQSNVNQIIAALPTVMDASGKIDTAKLTELLRVIGQPQVTPVNAMLGESVGKVLDGRKTAIGVIGSLVAYFLGGVTGTPTEITDSAGSVLGPLLGAIGSSSPYILPLTAATTLWGILGKVDKWVRMKK